MGGHMFLIRAAFWLSVVILFIPAGQSNDNAKEAQTVSAGEAFVAVHALWSDLSGFCERNPQVCATRDAALGTFTQKARNGVRILYRYLDGGDGATEAAGEPDARTEDAVLTVPATTSTIYSNGVRS